METVLLSAFAPRELSIIDESAKHAGHVGARAGGESHFAIRIVSSQFVGKSRVEQHRMVYTVLQPFIDEGVHAIGLETHAGA
jgi:BolA protein